jgi:hypothetical protein
MGRARLFSLLKRVNMLVNPCLHGTHGKDHKQLFSSNDCRTRREEPEQKTRNFRCAQADFSFEKIKVLITTFGFCGKETEIHLYPNIFSR